MSKTAKGRAKLHLLTAREVLNAQDGDHSDGGGLMLRVRAADNSAAWVFRYTAPSGRRREMGLGAAHRGNVQQAGAALSSARERAAKAREQLKADVDPITARENSREAERQKADARKAERQRDRWTLARCARDYHERVIEPVKTAKHGAQWISSLENHMLPSVWEKPITDIGAPELLSALLSISPHERARNHKGDQLPETVRRIRQRLDAVFEDAIFHGRCATNPAAAIKRKLREAMPNAKSGSFAALAFRDAPALMARLRRMQGTAARCLELAMLTAARTNEVISAQWREFDLDAATWVVPGTRMKAREEHVVFLSPQAVALLKAQQELTGGGLFVFPSTSNAEKSLSNMAMLAVLGRLGERENTTVHGLCRSTFSTWANETGVARPDVIEACLAHNEQDKVRAAYNRARFNEERKSLLAAWGSYLHQPVVEFVRLAA